MLRRGLPVALTAAASTLCAEGALHPITSDLKHILRSLHTLSTLIQPISACKSLPHIIHQYPTSLTQLPQLVHHQSNHRQHRQFASGTADDFNLISLESGLIRIEGYDETGFIVNDFQVEGPVICYGDMFLLWKVNSFKDITIDTLALLDVIKPPPDLLVLGCGGSIKPLPQTLVDELRKRRVNFEALDTVNAVSTFNILNQEDRKVVGALLPAGMD